MIKELRYFYDRRINIPKAHRGLVLDVGSGDKPHFMADILLDNFIDKKYGAQRNGDDKVNINKPLFVSDIADMPFKDKVFDFVIASHVLEHVSDPENAIKEIVRVGKAGYIEVPYIGYQKIYDFCSHLWYCDYKNKTLIFTAKRSQFFDKDIEKFVLNGNGLNIKVTDENKSVIRIYWKSNLKYKVIGKPSKVLMKQIIESTEKHNKYINLIRNIIGVLIRSYCFLKNHKSISAKDILKENIIVSERGYLKNKVYYPKQK